MSIKTIVAQLNTVFADEINDINATERLARGNTTQYVFGARPSTKSIFPVYSLKVTGSASSSYAAGDLVEPSEDAEDIEGYKLAYSVTLTVFVKRRDRATGANGFEIGGTFMSNAKLADYLSNALAKAIFKRRALFKTYPFEDISTKPSISEVYLESEDVFATDVSFVIEMLQTLEATPAELIAEMDDVYVIDYTI